MDPALAQTFVRVAIALGLGLLVGLQRERAQSRLAGIRTFALITVFGAIASLLAQSFGGWIIAGGALALASVLIVGNIAKIQQGTPDPGMTTEVAALVMYAVGCYIVVGHIEVAIAAGGIVAVLLHFKGTLHSFVQRMGENDFKATMQLVLIALVILPALPDQAFGPYQVLNPREIWMMVVLIVGISLGGYVAYKLFGQGAGTVLAGILGGLISSTATTVSYARRTKGDSEGASHAAVVIIIASTVAFARVIAEVAVVAPALLPSVAPPLAVMLAWMTLISAAWYLFGRSENSELPQHGNPAELKSALVFAAIYAVVLLAVAAAKEYFGNQGLYAVAVISGLTDMDAITLSSARLAGQGRLESATVWRVILIASLANLAFKAGAVGVLGSRRLLLQVVMLFSVAMAGGIALLLLWPL